MYDKLVATQTFINGDYELAADMFLEGAREGDAMASFNYAYCLWRALGRPYDPKSAKSYFSFARDLEGGASNYNLAMLYLHGEGVPQNFEKAAQYMRFSADQGCVEAQLYMGMACTLGAMFEPDVIGICLVPYHKPEYRDINSFLIEGNILDEEKEDKRYAVVAANEREAFYWFGRAARQNNHYVSDLIAKGKFLYAKCVIDGLGTEPSWDKGFRLMLSAGRNGSKEAVAYLKENGVTPAMILAAARRDGDDK